MRNEHWGWWQSSLITFCFNHLSASKVMLIFDRLPSFTWKTHWKLVASWYEDSFLPRKTVFSFFNKIISNTSIEKYQLFISSKYVTTTDNQIARWYSKCSLNFVSFLSHGIADFGDILNCDKISEFFDNWPFRNGMIVGNTQTHVMSIKLRSGWIVVWPEMCSN